MLSGVVRGGGGCDSGLWAGAADRGGAEWGGVARGIDHRGHRERGGEEAAFVFREDSSEEGVGGDAEGVGEF